MKLRRILHNSTPRWVLNEGLLPESWTLKEQLAATREAMFRSLQSAGSDQATDPNAVTLSPAVGDQEVWASGVTYLRSRMEREAESASADVYARVYDANRPEIFFKAIGWRTVGSSETIRIRKDSDWNVPEPEVTLVINSHREIVGWTVGNDVSSRSIEGENPLYLPQAKSYNRSCALGPVINLIESGKIDSLDILLEIIRNEETAFSGTASTSQMKRSFKELVEFLTREMDFPNGVFLMTGTGIVPAAPFTLLVGDTVRITIDGTTLSNEVAS